MEPSYTFIDHTADVLFEAQAPTIGELFEQCGLAVEDTQVNLDKVAQTEQIEIKGKNAKLDLLLFDFLDDLVYYKDAEWLIFSKFDAAIMKENEEFHLVCKAYGEKLDPEKHELRVDVKAITLHLFEVWQVEDGWKAKVLLDI